jgi:hypothetical protein
LIILVCSININAYAKVGVYARLSGKPLVPFVEEILNGVFSSFSSVSRQIGLPAKEKGDIIAAFVAHESPRRKI